MNGPRPETIAAIATPRGEGALGVIRISGPDAFAIVSEIFSSSSGKSLRELEPRRLTRGIIRDGSVVIDDILLVKMASPKSYTGDDLVEIHAHGGRYILARTLDLLYRLGARPASPGEFTRRAFLNGKLDLVQAESISWMIKARTEVELKSALEQLKGEPSRILKRVKSGLVRLLAGLEAGIDFSEFEEVGISNEEAEREAGRLERMIASLEKKTEDGVRIRDGLKVAIVGKPNVGKSSLLNLILKEDRAIVSKEPGTTRDTIEEVVDLDGLSLRMIDTAGITEAEDEIEKEGIRRSVETIKKSALVLLVLDKGTEIGDDDIRILKLLKSKPALILLNKSDLPAAISLDRVKGCLGKRRVIEISAKKKWGIEKIKREISLLIGEPGRINSDTPVLLSPSMRSNLRGARRAVARAREGARKRLSAEFIALELREALSDLKQLTGEEYRDDILEEIFSRFCVGK